MSLPNEFLMQVNGHWDETYYLRREDQDYYRLRNSCQSDEEAKTRHEFPRWSAESVERQVKAGSWIITKCLDEPDLSELSNIDLEEVL